VVGEERLLERPAEAAGLLGRGLHPTRTAVGRQDELRRHPPLLDGQIGDVREGELLVVLVPEGGSHVLDRAALGDDQREFAEPEHVQDGLVGVGDAGRGEHADEHRLEDVVEAVGRDGELPGPVEVLHPDGRLPAALAAGEAVHLVGVRLDRLVAEQPLRAVDEGSRGRDDEQIAAAEIGSGQRGLPLEAGGERTRELRVHVRRARRPEHKSAGRRGAPDEGDAGEGDEMVTFKRSTPVLGRGPGGLAGQSAALIG